MRASKVERMAARVWQGCVRRLTTRRDVSQQLVLRLVNEWSVPNSGKTFLQSHGELVGRPRAGSGEFWSICRLYNVRPGAWRTCTGEELLSSSKNFGGSTLPRYSRGNTMPLSTLSTSESDDERAASGIIQSDHPCETSANDEEFVPENVDTPSTPLVQAIRDSQNEEVTLDSVPPKSDGDTSEIGLADREIDPGRVFVGGLPFDMKGDELKQALHVLFEGYGTVQDVQLSQHRNQSKKSIGVGKHRGFAFVTMSSPEEAQTVIDKLNGESVGCRTITVSFGLKRVEPDPSAREARINNAARLARCKVFVGNLHTDTSLELLKSRFEQFGPVADAKLITELASRRSRGFGFITFEEEADAMKAILELDGSIVDGSIIRVNIAKYPQSV